MADKIARRHQNQTNRARPRNGMDKKNVYKSVLENPFHVAWPSVSSNVQNMLLAQIIQQMDGISAFNSAKNAQRRHIRRRRTGGASAAKSVADAPHSDTNAGPSNIAPEDSFDNSKIPELLNHLTIGVNEVTKDLELHAQSSRQTLISGPSESAVNTTSPCSKLVLVCKGDINPSILISHLPQLVASCNTHQDSSRTEKVWLVPLARGAEESIAGALGLRRASALTIQSTAPFFSELLPLLDSIPILTPPWVQASMAGVSSSLTPTHIKQLRTTAPKNIKEARQKKLEAKSLAKLRKKTSRLAST